MKRERRHELHTNVLAQWLSETGTSLKPYANAIVSVVLLACLVGAAVVLWTRYSSGGAEEAWDAFNRALEASREAGFANPAEFDDVAEKFPHTSAGQWAQVTSADIYLQQGCDQVLRDKVSANQQLQKALDLYLSILKESRVDPLRERATFGIARTYETLSGTRRAENELQQAIESYESVVKNWPKGAYAPQASRRLEQLRSPETKQFYDKLAQYEPRPIFADTPGTGGQDFGPGSVPPEPAKKAEGEKPGGSTSKAPAVPKAPPPPAPPAETSPPPAAKPAPAAEKPSPPAKPAEPKPGQK